MIQIAFEDWMVEEARKKAEALGSIRNSITSGEGNLTGYLCEIALAEYLGAENVSCDEGTEKHNYDLVFGDWKIECKSKRRTADPEPHYEVSIANTSKHQKTDIYAFMSVTFRNKEGRGRNATYSGVKAIWLCGFMGKEEFFAKGRFVPKGKIDPSNGFVCHANMVNMPISELYPKISLALANL